MCGRFAQQRPASELAELFAAEPLVDDAGARFNLAPTDPALVVVQRDDRAVVSYGWGLVPHWATSAGDAARTINARAETVAVSPTFRESFRRRRCIVPADAFYEWRRDGGVRQPFVIRRRDGLPLAFAGLWAGWRDPVSGDVRRTFAIVTVGANAVAAPVHDRMPVILRAGAWATWLDPTLVDPGELHGLLVPADPDALEVYPVRRLVNSIRNDGPELLAPLTA